MQRRQQCHTPLLLLRMLLRALLFAVVLDFSLHYLYLPPPPVAPAQRDTVCMYYVVISENGPSAARGLFKRMHPIEVFWGGYFVLNFMCVIS